MVAGRRADGELGRHLPAQHRRAAGFHRRPAQRRRDRTDRDLFHQRPVEGHHRADGADNSDGLQRPAARLGGRNRGNACAGAAELRERWLHRRGAEPRAVPDRPARRRPALYWHTLTTSPTRPTSEITIALPRTRSPSSLASGARRLKRKGDWPRQVGPTGCSAPDTEVHVRDTVLALEDPGAL